MLVYVVMTVLNTLSIGTFFRWEVIEDLVKLRLIDLVFP